MKKLFLIVFLFVAGGLTGIFSQPYLPTEWQGWLDDQQVRIDTAVSAFESEEGGVIEKARTAADAVVQAPADSR